MLAVHRDVGRQHFLLGDLGKRLLGHQFEGKLNRVALDSCITFEETPKMLNTIEAK